MNESIHLSLSNVSKFYKKVKAVDSINLSVPKGKFLTILGPSGSGKTSLLKLVAGFEDVSGGSIRLNNEEITKRKPHEREIGMLFQNYALFPHMTVAENIAYPLRLRKLNKAKIAEKVQSILQLVHLEEYKDRYPVQLSGGQQQRVALARAIVFNPPLLLLDEPLGALDKNLREQMQLEIKHIQEKVGITTISVTHDQEEALTMSDYVCVMNKGKIEQLASPKEIYQAPKNRFVAEFIGEINLLVGERLNEKDSAVRLLGQDNHIIHVDAPNGYNASEAKVLIAIRPENMKFVPEPHTYENSLHVSIEEKIYSGDSFKIRVQTSFGKELTMKAPIGMAESFTIGDMAWIGWDRPAATLLSYEANAI